MCLKAFKYICVFVYTIAYIDAHDIAKSYPSYPYVLNEFDIDKEYIHNDEFITFVQHNEKKLIQFYKRSLQRGKEILPLMKNILIGEGVSDVFIYLSMIESGFSSSAISAKKAVGLWQFMPKTAKNYHLTVSDTNDERCDTALATRAAVSYLNKLHKEFGKWYLAVMAYNCGESALRRAIQKAGTDDVSVLTDNQLKYLPKETRLYIKKILMVAMIGENNTIKYEHVISKSFKDNFVDVEVKGGTDLKKLAKFLHINYHLLCKLNSKISNGIVPNVHKKYKITIPIEKIFAFYLQYNMQIEPKKCYSHFVSHYVKLGETLESIALMYHTQSEAIMRENHLKDIYLSVGQFLVVPVSQEIFENISIGSSK